MGGEAAREHAQGREPRISAADVSSPTPILTRKPASDRPVLAIHGGASTVAATCMTAKREARYRAALTQALRAGYAVLDAGGGSLDAVVAAVIVLEDSPLFNAGRGAVFNADARHELDAAVMDGAACRAGAVAAVRRIRNPVLAARVVMEQTPHVLLAAAGAERLARRVGLTMVATDYFSTASCARALSRVRKQAAEQARLMTAADHHGTVGAVARDRSGNLAAATSTGGHTNKLAGRLGDSPLVGAGIYADNAACAVSATGHGESFIRAVLAYDVAARMRYRGETLAAASRGALERVTALGGEGGLIAVDRSGNMVMPFSSEGMYRGWVARGKFEVAIYQ